MIWTSDLVFDPTWPIFKLVRDFIKANSLTKSHEYQTENVAPKVYTRFFQDLTWWPSFWPNVTHFQTCQRFLQANILTKFHAYQTETVAFS